MSTVLPSAAAAPMPRKAVIVLGFGTSPGQANPVTSLPYGALAERLPAVERQGIQQAVEEALSAGLMELVFLTRDGAALAPVGGLPQQVVLSRSPGGNGLGAALRAARTLIGTEPFVVLAPESLATAGRGAVARLLAAYRRHGGNLAVIDNEETLLREGTFTAIARAAAGLYLLQPAVLDALDGVADLGEALLRLAEAWPVTALPAGAGPAAPPRQELAGAAD
ncbi:hypothetical protein [Pelagibius marinus]|uniref:hypothetical protein n=1 Tax=Pelagibius marinus TaxID=2762760 RepID=UPI0018730346|nr:hypothetical protein [Pelagibius marinus]